MVFPGYMLAPAFGASIGSSWVGLTAGYDKVFCGGKSAAEHLVVPPEGEFAGRPGDNLGCIPCGWLWPLAAGVVFNIGVYDDTTSKENDPRHGAGRLSRKHAEELH